MDEVEKIVIIIPIVTLIIGFSLGFWVASKFF